MFNITPTVRLLLIINVLVFLVPQILNSSDVIYNYGSLHYVGSKYFGAWQFLTYQFLHANFSHLFMNMFGLVVFGSILEQYWGQNRFLVFYLLCGVGAGLLYSGWQWYNISSLVDAADAYYRFPGPEQLLRFLREQGYEWVIDANRTWLENYANAPESRMLTDTSLEMVKRLVDMKVNTPMLGASGAVYGVMAAFALLFPNMELMLLFPPIPIRAKYLVGIYALIEVYRGWQQNPNDNVAHLAHLGGMFIALIFVLLWKKNNRFY